jgi:NAD(P)-dependent dehydrogenase (short-subunit alcohol dehydrogenase family)
MSLLYTMQVNVVGALHTAAALRDLLADSAPSQIINVGPVSGTVGAPSDVAAAVAAAVASPARERTVPRSYRPLMALRHIAPPLFWALASRTSRARGTRVA